MKAMYRVFALTLCVAVGLLTACSHPKPAEDEAGVQQWIADFTHAFDARDTNAVMELYTPDVVAYDVVPPLQYVGRDDYGKDFARFFAGFKGPLDLQYADVHTQVSGDLAFIEGLERVQGTMTSGEKVDFWVRFTTGLRKVNGRWLDFHDHVSVPVEISTGKAVMDLKP